MIHGLLQLFIYITIIDALLSYVPQFRTQAWAQMIHKIADALQKPLRNLFPRDIPLDPSPIIVILLCQLLMHLL